MNKQGDIVLALSFFKPELHNPMINLIFEMAVKIPFMSR